MSINQREIFLSHAATDREVAALLEETLTVSVPGIHVFRASRVGQISGGREWFDVVTSHLRDAESYIVLLSERSVTKPWVSFETGAAWYTQRPLKPVLVPGFSPSGVPEPLRFFQILSLADANEAEQLFTELGGKLENPQLFVSRAGELVARDKLRSMAEQGWVGIEFGRDFYAINGPLERLPEADPVQMPDELPDTFKQAGFDLVFGTPGRLESQFSQGYRRIWRIVGWERKHSLLDRHRQQLCARPKKTEHT